MNLIQNLIKNGEIMASKKKVIKKKANPSSRKTKKASKNKLGNVVVWFEIPVLDIGRAVQFYSTVLGIHMEVSKMGNSKRAMFPFSPEIASGALIQSRENKPGTSGTMIYLDGGKDLSRPLSLVVKAGGKIVQKKVEIGEYGFMAIIEDTEGNHIALHSMS